MQVKIPDFSLVVLVGATASGKSTFAARNKIREDRKIPGKVVHDHVQRLRKSLRGLEREGFRSVHIMRSEENVAGATVLREPLWCDRRGERGPFDIIGDVHGCLSELE